MRIPFKTELAAMYGKEKAASIDMVEAFQLCEYGRRPAISELHSMFPELPERIDLFEK